MTCGIYMLTNDKTGQKYIGQSIDIERRFHEHSERSSDLKIKKAIEKYGIENFSLKILKITKELNKWEIYFIKKFNTFEDDFHYNQTRGGSTLSPHSYKFPEERRKKLSELSKKRWKDPTMREKMINNMKGGGRKGSKWSEKAKKEASLRWKEWHKHNTHQRLGKHDSDEVKKKKSLSMSKKMTKTGIYRVSISIENSSKQGWVYKYKWKTNDGKSHSTQSVDLKTLEKKVKEKNLPWKIIDESKYNSLKNSPKENILKLFKGSGQNSKF